MENKLVDEVAFFAQKGASLSELIGVAAVCDFDREYRRSGEGPLSYQAERPHSRHPLAKGIGQGCETSQSYQLLLGHRNNQSSTTAGFGPRRVYVTGITVSFSQRDQKAAGATRPSQQQCMSSRA
jgi:hypothetical protein